MAGGSLIQNIRRQLSWDQEVKIRHSFINENCYVEELANFPCDEGFSLIVYGQCHTQISLVYLVYCMGISTPRLVKW